MTVADLKAKGPGGDPRRVLYVEGGRMKTQGVRDLDRPLITAQPDRCGEECGGHYEPDP